jgi:hypothetical protein
LPAFGVAIDVASPPMILTVMKRFVKNHNTMMISDVTPLEAFLKSFSIAEKRKDEFGKNRAREGFLAVVSDALLEIVSHQQREVFERAFKIRLKHKDPFDCFIFATALAENALLISEDESSVPHVGKDRVMKWAEFARKV